MRRNERQVYCYYSKANYYLENFNVNLKRLYCEMVLASPSVSQGCSLALDLKT